MSTKVDIGVLEEKESWLLHSRFFPSKVGGKPAWLDLRSYPSNEELTCRKCKDPLIFLCQIYAPIEESENSHHFHRTIFIFICKNGQCCLHNDSDNLVVFRCQLPRKNEYYSFNPYEEKDEVFPMDNWPKLCEVCGVKAPSHCSKCKTVYYCSRKHQILDWQKGHKEICSTLQAGNTQHNNYFVVTKSGKTLLFKEWDLIVDEEDEEDVKDVNVNQEMEKLQKMIQDKKAGTLENVSENELEQYTKGIPEDKVFKKFSKRVARHPDQVLRYDRGGDPLWITKQLDSLIVPPCEYCMGERQFEFQIMPQLLNYIDVGIELNSIDWGVLAIYTCKSSCNEGPAYKKEHIIKQDLTN